MIALRRACLAAVLLPGLVMVQPSAGSPAPPLTPGMAELVVHFDGLRSTRGLVRVCLTRDRSHYPHCEGDPVAFRASVAAAPGARIALSDVPPGDYALLVMHDENSNARVDTWMGIPREGVGFSGNPRIRFGAPDFNRVRFTLGTGPSETTVRLQYFL